MTLYVSVPAPAQWVRTGSRGDIVDHGSAAESGQLPRPRADEAVIAVVPGDDVAIYTVRVPARRRTALLAALPYSLEDWLSEEPERLHFALLSWNQASEQAVVAVVARAQIDAWIASLAEAGLRPRIMVPETLLVPIHGQTRATVLCRSADEYLVRGPELAAGLYDATTVRLWWQELQDPAIPLATNDAQFARWLVDNGATHVHQWPVGVSWTDWVGLLGGVPPGNLLEGDYAATRPLVPWARLWPAAAMAGTAAALTIGVDLYDHVRLDREHRSLESNIAELYQQTFPGARPPAPGRARQQFEQRLKRATGDSRYGDFSELLGAVARVMPGAGARIEELSFRDNQLTVACTSGDFSGIERLKQSFEREVGLRVELLSSGAREQQVTARFRLSRAPA